MDSGQVQRQDRNIDDYNMFRQLGQLLTDTAGITVVVFIVRMVVFGMVMFVRV